MKIFIDINHPAHVHYFRNFIKIMEGKGHEFIITNRDSKMINYLLDYYKIPHIIRNSRSKHNGKLGGALTLLAILKTVLKESLRHKPDMYVGFANAPSAILARVLGKPCILLDDTEHNGVNHKLYLPFTSVVLTPFYFNKNLGKKQVYFNAFVEQLYLHSNVFDVDERNISQAGFTQGSYALVRYIAYDAHHDVNVKPVDIEDKINLLEDINRQIEPILSVEEGIKGDYPNKYMSSFKAETIHDIEVGAQFILSEGGTMATECFLLGTPYIVINPLRSGASDYQTSMFKDVAIQTTNLNAIRDRIQTYIRLKIDKKLHRKNIEESTIDPTKLLVWFVENYPDSKQKLRNNPDYQNNFK